MDPKNFLKAPVAPIYTSFEGGARVEKRDFLVKIFQKVPKNAFFGLFFQNYGRARKINLIDLKKRSAKFFENPNTPPPPPYPLEKILDPPLYPNTVDMEEAEQNVELSTRVPIKIYLSMVYLSTLENQGSK